MVVVVKSHWFILFSQFWGTCFFFVFMHASCWQNCSAPRAWKEVLGICEGVWQQRNISVLTKRQGEEGKRICSHRRIDHPSQVWSLSPAFHFSDLPPVNKTGTSRTAPEVLWLFKKCSGVFIIEKQSQYGQMEYGCSLYSRLCIFSF